MDTQLQNKLTGFEVLPPEGVWDAVVAGLESEDFAATRLFHFEEAPPETAWSRIEQGLSTADGPAKVVSFSSRFRKPMRYAAVASVIGVVLITSTLLMKRTEAGSIQTHSIITVPTQPTKVPLPKNADTIGAGHRHSDSTHR